MIHYHISPSKTKHNEITVSTVNSSYNVQLRKCHCYQMSTCNETNYTRLLIYNKLTTTELEGRLRPYSPCDLGHYSIGRQRLISQLTQSMTSSACPAGVTRDLPVFLARVVTRSTSGGGVDAAMSRVSVTTLSRSTSVASGVTFATGASDVDATTSFSVR